MKTRKRKKLEREIDDCLVRYKDGDRTAHKFCVLTRVYMDRYGDDPWITEMCREYEEAVRGREY